MESHFTWTGNLLTVKNGGEFNVTEKNQNTLDKTYSCMILQFIFPDYHY